MDVEEFEEKLTKASEKSKYGDFEKKVTNKLSQRRDLHVFLLLDKLIPDKSRDIIAAAEHDMIYLEGHLEEIAEVITDEQIEELAHCGVFIDDGLSMFV